MADHRKPSPNTRLRAVRELEFQMSRSEFAKKVNEAGKAMGENVNTVAFGWSVVRQAGDDGERDLW